MKSEKGAAYVQMIISICVLLALIIATIFMVGDGLFFNKDIENKNEENNSSKNNTTTNTVQIIDANTLVNE